MDDLTRLHCDFRLGEVPGEKPCNEPVVYECSCERCQEDPFRSCAAHAGDVRLSHARVFPAHPVRWVQVAAAPQVHPMGAPTPTYGSCLTCGGAVVFVGGARGAPFDDNFPRLFDARDHLIMRHTPFDLRCLGWSVAVHNDYKLNGARFTFWLLTKGDRCVKGEGQTDLQALDTIRAQLRRQESGT